jgi:hypothetical protein
MEMPMCEVKANAKSMAERLIEAMDRLSAALQNDGARLSAETLRPAASPVKATNG